MKQLSKNSDIRNKINHTSIRINELKNLIEDYSAHRLLDIYSLRTKNQKDDWFEEYACLLTEIEEYASDAIDDIHNMHDLLSGK